jgi:predicted nucleic acid-binding protein
MTCYVRGSLSCSSVLPDPTDNIFLECALDGSADFIISGDRHLLDIKVYRGIEIVKAGEFLLKEGLPHS